MDALEADGLSDFLSGGGVGLRFGMGGAAGAPEALPVDSEFDTEGLGAGSSHSDSPGKHTSEFLLRGSSDGKEASGEFSRSLMQSLTAAFWTVELVACL